MKRLLFLIYLLPLWALGQSGLHLQFMPNAPTGQFFQPALLAEMDMHAVRLSGDGSLWFNSSSLTYGTLQGATNYLTDEFKQELIADLDAGNSFQAGYHYSQMLNFKIGKSRWGLSWRNRWGVNANFDNPLSMGLLLRGNAPYAGQTISDDGIFVRNFRYWEIGLATAFELGKKAKIGIRPKVLFGQRLFGIENFDYSLFTAADGSRIDVEGAYDFIFGARDNLVSNQMGFGLDLGFMYDITEAWRLQASVIDLGQIAWNADRYNSDFDLDYEGIDLVDLITTDDGSNAVLITDTLRTLLRPDSTLETILVGLPTQLSLAVGRKIGQKGSLMLSAHIAPGELAPRFEQLLVNLTYHHQFTKWLMLGINAYGGGPDQYGLGAVGMIQIVKEDQLFISIYGGMDNAMGLLLPALGQGSGAQVGVSMGF